MAYGYHLTTRNAALKIKSQGLQSSEVRLGMAVANPAGAFARNREAMEPRLRADRLKRDLAVLIFAGATAEQLLAVHLDAVPITGYQPLGAAGYRIDMLERFAATARKLAREKITILPPENLSILGINAVTGADVLRALGFKARVEENGLVFRVKRRRPPGAQPLHKGKAPAAPVNSDSPFAKLKELMSS